MGVYIPNMEKPKNCRTCKFKSNKEGECWFVHYDIDCPLIDMDLVRCGECKHKPIKHDPEGDDFGFNLVSPNGYDNLCPCLNTDDGFYSYMPDDNFFCAYGERRE